MIVSHVRLVITAQAQPIHSRQANAQLVLIARVAAQLPHSSMQHQVTTLSKAPRCRSNAKLGPTVILAELQLANLVIQESTAPKLAWTSEFPALLATTVHWVQ